MSKQSANDAVGILDLLIKEVYYGTNLAIILSEASQSERDIIRLVLLRAEINREQALKRLKNG